MAKPKYDLLIKNVTLVRPKKNTTPKSDIAIKDGKIVKVAAEIKAETAAKVVDGKMKLAFPGLVDPQLHAYRRVLHAARRPVRRGLPRRVEAVRG